MICHANFVTMLCWFVWTDAADEKSARSEFIDVTHDEQTLDLNFLQENNSIDNGFLFHHAHSRHKRQAQPRVRTIETAIFVDSHLRQRFENRLHDLKRLVLSIMHEVQLIYAYQSMKIPIRIVIVKLEVLETPESSPNNAGGDIDRYLDNFCSWQVKRHRSTSEGKWDHALMLTGYVFILSMFSMIFIKNNKPDWICTKILEGKETRKSSVLHGWVLFPTSVASLMTSVMFAWHETWCF